MVKPPHDLDAERSVLGAVLVWPAKGYLEQLRDQLVPSDFYQPAHARVFAAMLDLHATGRIADLLTVKDAADVDGADLLAMQSEAVTLRPEHVAIVQRHALARRLQGECIEAMSAIENGDDPAELVERLRTTIETLDGPLAPGRLFADTLDAIIDAGESLAPWIVPGLVRSDWRVIVVGPEGRGKSVLLRQIAACAAQGVHPFRNRRIAPVRALVLDAENPAGAIAETGRQLVEQLRRTVGNEYDAGRLLVVRCNGDLDLRRRPDRLGVESMLARHRPQLVVAGPLYQLFSRRSRERDDEATEPVLRLFDDWRRRFGFALLLEHHAPHGAPGSPREMRPYGSSLLNRWPEIGLGLRHRDGSLEVGRWRGDRMRNDWPDRLDRGRVERGEVWPWAAKWNGPADEEIDDAF